jgi:hypothetical protein
LLSKPGHVREHVIGEAILVAPVITVLPILVENMSLGPELVEQLFHASVDSRKDVDSHIPAERIADLDVFNSILHDGTATENKTLDVEDLLERGEGVWILTFAGSNHSVQAAQTTLLACRLLTNACHFAKKDMSVEVRKIDEKK